MRHFDQLAETDRLALFEELPGEFDLTSDRTTLAHALGATLYVPATRSDLRGTLSRRAAEGVRSLVIDLEDAVADHEVADAALVAGRTLAELATEQLPALLFVRVRTPEHIAAIGAVDPAELGALAGFVLPKFTAATGARFLAETAAVSTGLGRTVYAMPVLETPEVLYRETRDEALSAVRDLLAQYREHILAVRLGATDLCGLYGIRRDRDLTIYDVGVVAELISQVVNHLGRTDGTGYAITGPVWEYFAGHERLFRPQLRATPFAEKAATRFRHRLVKDDADALLREVVLDRANGLTGKTVIHPSHVPVVHALSVVPHEEYRDALDVLGSDLIAVQASGYRNKMNETRPHRRWAQRVVDRASVFGVARDEVSHVDILTALVAAQEME